MECCDFKFTRGSIISTEWKKAFIYHGQNHKTSYISYVDAEAIVRHCLVIPDIRDGSEIYHENIYENLVTIVLFNVLQ